ICDGLEVVAERKDLDLERRHAAWLGTAARAARSVDEDNRYAVVVRPGYLLEHVPFKPHPEPVDREALEPFRRIQIRLLVESASDGRRGQRDGDERREKHGFESPHCRLLRFVFPPLALEAGSGARPRRETYPRPPATSIAVARPARISNGIGIALDE